ncbi:MAG: UDP-N-acetylmuramoyl-L-alanine--D-glutamate ligase [Pseudomonadales bacterium]|nr:UDP-N-acetylmuramoyl-L-alanine--D-glutamate ligase [Pseudomonadales bacterium]
MSNINDLLKDFDSKTIIILGLGREGLSSYQFFREHLPEKKLYLVDDKKLSDLDSVWMRIGKEDRDTHFSTSITELTKDEKFVASNNTARNFIIIKSPGIPPKNQLLLESVRIKSEFTSNTNIFFQLIETLEEGTVNVIGVTGTKGKSTTTSMIHHVLKNCNLQSILGGNIGIPPLSLWNKIKKLASLKNLASESTHTANTSKNIASESTHTANTSKNIASESTHVANTSKNTTKRPINIVLEMSCHQLKDAVFSPTMAVILDITPEHLDYYQNFEEYIQAKSQIARFQKSSDLLIFSDNEVAQELSKLSKAKKISFSLKNNVRHGEIIYKNEVIIKTEDLPVTGKHNILNSIPSIIIAKELGCETSDIQQSLMTFKTLPHRLEMVSNSDGIIYVNDSLSTTPASTIAAIDSFNNSPIILIVGGHERNLKLEELAKTISNSNIKHLILLPDTGRNILQKVRAHEDALGLNDASRTRHTYAENMKEAVAVAKEIANQGDVVLLSPAAASFGHFRDYQDRGEQFKKFVCN